MYMFMITSSYVYYICVYIRLRKSVYACMFTRSNQSCFKDKMIRKRLVGLVVCLSEFVYSCFAFKA